MEYFAKFKGQSVPLPPRASLRHIAFSWLGGLLAVAAVGYLAYATHQPWVMGSLGASCVLLFAFPDSPFSQPRNVIVGHFLSTLIGLACLHFIGPQWWSMAFALASALAVMQLTRTVHPPAGSNPLIVFLAGADWSFLLTPNTVGSVTLVVVALLYINLSRTQRYPSYWI